MDNKPCMENMLHVDESRDVLRCNDMVLAMAYVPVQSWERVNSPEEALCRGTQFPELDKPFFGEDVWR